MRRLFTTIHVYQISEMFHCAQVYVQMIIFLSDTTVSETKHIHENNCLQAHCIYSYIFLTAGKQLHCTKTKDII